MDKMESSLIVLLMLEVCHIQTKVNPANMHTHNTWMHIRENKIYTDSFAERHFVHLDDKTQTSAWLP